MTTPYTETVQIDQNYGVAKVDDNNRAEVTLSANVWDSIKNHPVDGHTEVSVTAGLTANTRHSMSYWASVPYTYNGAIFDSDHIPANDAGVPSCEDYHVVIPFSSSIGQWFHYFGNWYNQLYVTIDGLIVLDIYADMYQVRQMDPVPMGSSGEPNTLIAPMWRDMRFDSSSRLLYGEPRNKDSSSGLADVFFAVVWKNAICESDGKKNTFAVLFHATFGRDDVTGHYISFVYDEVSSMSTTTKGGGKKKLLEATTVPKYIGVEDQSGNFFTQVDPTTITGGTRVDITPSQENFYVINKVEVYAEKVTETGANDVNAAIKMSGWVNSRPGGMNVNQIDDAQGGYSAFPSVVSGARLALQLYRYATMAATVVTPWGLALTAGVFAANVLLASYLSESEPSAKLDASGSERQTAYYKADTFQERCPNPDTMDFAWDISLFPVIEWEIFESSFTSVHKLRIWAVIWVGDYEVTTGYPVTTDCVTLTLQPSDVPEGYSWLPRTTLDNAGCTFRHVEATIDGVDYEGYSIEADYETQSGYDMLGWSKLTKETTEDYLVRNDGTVRIEGYFRQEDSVVTQSGRSVKGYLMTQNLQHVLWSENILTSNDPEDAWIFKSVRIGYEEFYPGTPCKIGVGRPVNWANEKFLAGWVGTQVFDEHYWALNVASTPGGTVYYRDPVDGIVDDVNDDIRPLVNNPRDFSWRYACPPDGGGLYGTVRTWVYADPEDGFAFSHWEVDGAQTTNNPMCFTWDGSGDSDHTVRACFVSSYSIPSAPRDVSATPSMDSIVVAWSPPASTGGGVDNYLVHRKTYTTSYSPLVTLSGTILSYSDTSVSIGQKYSYRVYACNAAGTSPASSEVSAGIGNTPPEATIDSISPSPAQWGDTISFSGYGIDPDPGGSITAYRWRSNISGVLSVAQEFTSSELPPGSHTIYFRVTDCYGAYSSEVSENVSVISPPGSYVLTVDTNGPSGCTNPAVGTYQCTPGTDVSLCAEPDLIIGDLHYIFRFWRVDGVNMGFEVMCIQVTMNTDHTADAVYWVGPYM